MAIFNFIGDYIFPIIIVLGVLVFVHELGHFLAAKLFGVRVERFSIGFPPRMFGVQVGETDYCISAVPLGGYVKLTGMIDESMDTENLNEEPKPYEFRAKPTYQQVIIITAGVIMNFLLAVGILGGMIWMQGEPITPTTTVGIVVEGGIADSLGVQVNDKFLEINGVQTNNWQDVSQLFIENVGNETHFKIDRGGEIKNILLSWDNLQLNDLERLGVGPLMLAKVGELSPSFPAMEAGLQRGDQIVAINDSAIHSWNDMTDIIYNNADVPLFFSIVRDGEPFMVEITPKAVPVQTSEGEESTRGIIGIGPYMEHKAVDFFPAMGKGVERALFMGQLNIKGFGRILSGKDSAQESLAGPIAIAKMAGDVAKQDLLNLIQLIAYLSVVLAFINILPIPALDGGHLVIILIEGIRRKPLPLRAKMMVQQIGMVFLLLLIIFVFYNDIAREIAR